MTAESQRFPVQHTGSETFVARSVSILAGCVIEVVAVRPSPHATTSQTESHETIRAMMGLSWQRGPLGRDGEKLEPVRGQSVLPHGPDCNLTVDEIGGIQLAEDAATAEA
jgi:hypothetical protein